MTQNTNNALAGFDWNQVLSKVAERWRSAFKEYALTGQASDEFLSYLNESDECDEALDAVLDYMMCALSNPIEAGNHANAAP